jgi:methionyl-tRNA formyltransferase
LQTWIVAGHGLPAYSVLKALLALQARGEVRVLGLLPWETTERGRPKAGLWAKGGLLLEQALSQHREQEANALLRLAKQEKTPVFTGYTGLNDPAFHREVLEKQPPTGVIVASWGERVWPATLEAFTHLHWVNVHPSLLPAHRGPNPYVSALLQGETQTGVTAHTIEASFDTGAVWAQVPVAVLPQDTGGSLRLRCCAAMEALVPLLVERSHHLERHPPEVQNEALASYFTARQVNACWLNWQEAPELLERRVRALQPWGLAVTMVENGHWLGLGSLALRDMPHEDSSKPWVAGLILKSEGWGSGLRLTVATSQRGCVAVLTGLRAYGYANWLPAWLTPIVLQRQLRVGCCFLAPPFSN